jgi:hypothetical protein
VRPRKELETGGERQRGCRSGGGQRERTANLDGGALRGTGAIDSGRGKADDQPFTGRRIGDQRPFIWYRQRASGRFGLPVDRGVTAGGFDASVDNGNGGVKFSANSDGRAWNRDLMAELGDEVDGDGNAYGARHAGGSGRGGHRVGPNGITARGQLTVLRVEGKAEPAGGLGFGSGGCLLPESNAQLGGAERGDNKNCAKTHHSTPINGIGSPGVSGRDTFNEKGLVTICKPAALLEREDIKLIALIAKVTKIS